MPRCSVFLKNRYLSKTLNETQLSFDDFQEVSIREEQPSVVRYNDKRLDFSTWTRSEIIKFVKIIYPFFKMGMECVIWKDIAFQLARAKKKRKIRDIGLLKDKYYEISQQYRLICSESTHCTEEKLLDRVLIDFDRENKYSKNWSSVEDSILFESISQYLQDKQPGKNIDWNNVMHSVKGRLNRSIQACKKRYNMHLSKHFSSL